MTLRHKPPCLSADPLECNQQVRLVISSVIIFSSSIQADGQITEQWTGHTLPSLYMPFPSWCLFFKFSPLPVECMFLLSRCTYVDKNNISLSFSFSLSHAHFIIILKLIIQIIQMRRWLMQEYNCKVISLILYSVCQNFLLSLGKDLNSNAFNWGHTNGSVSGLHQRYVSGHCPSDHIITMLLS